MIENLSSHREMLVTGGRADPDVRVVGTMLSSAATSAISTNSRAMIFFATLVATSAMGLKGPRDPRDGRGVAALQMGEEVLGSGVAAARRLSPEPAGEAENVGTDGGRGPGPPTYTTYSDTTRRPKLQIGMAWCSRLGGGALAQGTEGAA